MIGRNFTYTALPARVVFGRGTSVANVAEEVERLGCQRVIILTTQRQVHRGEPIRDALRAKCVGIYKKATMHTPVEITNDALEYALSLQADCAVSVGGGSTIGLGKALALASKGAIRHISIPTTYAGSEATPIIGQTANGIKTTQKSNIVIPQSIIYDVDQTLSLPVKITVTSGINAIAHSVEALYSAEANPIIELLALSSIEKVASAIPQLHQNPQDVQARYDALYGAWACGTCLGSVGMGLHHKICHTLGGSFNMPHAETHTVILPHAIAYNQPYAEEALSKVAKALGHDSAARAMFDLSYNHGGPTSLRELGFKQEDIQAAVDIAMKASYPNPAPLESQKLLKLMTNAYHGTRP